jgi:hypothetical protein
MPLQGARRALGFSVVLAFPTRALALDPAHEFEANADLHLGVATTPFYTAEYPRAEGRGGALVFGGAWHAQGGFSVGLGVPLVFVRLTEPGAEYRDEPAWGNPFFSAEWRMPFERRPAGSVEGFLRLGIGAPLADYGPPGTLSKSRALAVADGLRGWQERELFAAGFLPFAVTAGASFESGIFRGEGSMKFAPLVRINDADLPDGTPRPFAFSMLAAASGIVSPVPEIGIGARASLLIDAVPQAGPVGANLQFVMTPLASFRVGSHFTLGTEFVIPVGGPLGGNAVGFGIHAAVVW